MKGVTTCLIFLLLLMACGNRGNTAWPEETSKQVGNPVMAATNTVVSGSAARENSDIQDMKPMPILNLTVEGSVFPVRLYDNDAAKELVKRMPMELDMGELNGNEKYFYFQDALPTDTQSVGSIRAGDIMLYGSDCLVLFYEEFQTTFDYTRLGYLEEAEGLAEILGEGSVKVSFDLE